MVLFTISNISLGINYDVPRDKENYIHRIGTTKQKRINYEKQLNEQRKKYEKKLIEILNLCIDSNRKYFISQILNKINNISPYL